MRKTTILQTFNNVFKLIGIGIEKNKKLGKNMQFPKRKFLLNGIIVYQNYDY